MRITTQLLIDNKFITPEQLSMIIDDWPERTPDEWKVWHDHTPESIDDLARSISDKLDFREQVLSYDNSELGQAYLDLVYGIVTMIGFFS